jgi:hypothetical protein
MYLLTSGVVVFILTAITFWYSLPRGGISHRFVDTEWEPYIGVAFCAAIALAFTMILAGGLNLIGGG